MNSGQLSHFLNMDRYTKGCWKGFVAQDSEPFIWEQTRAFPALYIINTDVSEGPGKHWCVGYLDFTPNEEEEEEREMEFFDSYGCPPGAYGLDRLFPTGEIRVNTRTVQSWDSSTCGHHCLFFAYFRCRGMGMEEIVRLYSDDLKRNDEMVTKFVLQHGKVFRKRNAKGFGS